MDHERIDKEPRRSGLVIAVEHVRAGVIPTPDLATVCHLAEPGNSTALCGTEHLTPLPDLTWSDVPGNTVRCERCERAAEGG